MAQLIQLHTAADLWDLPDGNRHYELVRGELRPMTPAGIEHGRIVAKLTWRLMEYASAHNLGLVVAGEPGFWIGTQPDTVRAPDVAFIRQERLAGASEKGFWHGAPDLAVEVISPNDKYTEVDEKIADWLAAGTQLIFVVNPRRSTVKVYEAAAPVRELAETDILDGGSVVPGWALPVRDLFV